MTTTITVPDATDFELLPADYYPARLVDFREVDKKPEWVDAENPDTKQWEWKFELEGDNVPEGQTIKRWTSRKMGRGSYARETVEALLGRELVTGEELNIDDLIGSRCRLNVTEKKRDDGTLVNRVRQALPLIRNRRAVIPPPVTQEPLFPGDDGSDIPFGVEEGETKPAAGKK